jgi:CheY-like chemotaxis protein
MSRSAALQIERPAPDPRTIESSLSFHSPKMLIVDDDPSVLRLLANHCTRLGFDVETATNGMQALLKASRIQPKILVIDVNLPELDGLSACAHLLGPDRSPVDVIVITGSRGSETPERCEGFGAYYAHKGPNFWRDLEVALAEIEPRLVGKIGQYSMGEAAPEIRRRPRVLLVDDDSDVNRMLASRLAKCGIDVMYASDATHGLRMASQDEPAVIVTDYFMPNGDALYFLTRLRTAKVTSKIPVIVWSGRKLSEQTDQRLRREISGCSGAAHILCKSEDTSALFEILQKFCGFESTSDGSYASDDRPLFSQVRRLGDPRAERATAAFGHAGLSGKRN